MRFERIIPNLLNKSKLKLSVAILTCLFALTVSHSVHAQEDDLLNSLQGGQDDSRDPVTGTFGTTAIVNIQSTEVLGRNVFDFRVSHRFGPMFGDNGGYHNWYGLDNLSDIRIGLEYGILERLMVGVGRSKAGERIDGFVKYKVLQQTKKSMPLSLTVYANAAISAGRNTNDAFGQPRFPDIASRMTYTVQIIAARKFGKRLSVALSPMMVYQNYASAYYHDAAGQSVVDENAIFSLAAAVKLKVTPSFGIVVDYTQIFSPFRQNHPSSLYQMPLGVGAEFEVGGHVFSVNLSNAGGLLPNEFVTNTTTGWQDGEFRLGFCISRTFSPGKKIIKSKKWKEEEPQPAAAPVEIQDTPVDENQE